MRGSWRSGFGGGAGRTWGIVVAVVAVAGRFAVGLANILRVLTRGCCRIGSWVAVTCAA